MPPVDWRADAERGRGAWCCSLSDGAATAACVVEAAARYWSCRGGAPSVLEKKARCRCEYGEKRAPRLPCFCVELVGGVGTDAGAAGERAPGRGSCWWGKGPTPTPVGERDADAGGAAVGKIIEGTEWATDPAWEIIGGCGPVLASWSGLGRSRRWAGGAAGSGVGWLMQSDRLPLCHGVE